MSEYWLKPKSYGYGATPSNWQGWVADGVFTVLVPSISLLIVGLQLNAGTGLGAWQIAAWALFAAAATLGFIWLARAKTDGQWGWRWGK
jgi:hypothetical protein